MKTSGLFCGAARGLITPPAHLLPSLRGLQDRPIGGVLDDLFVRVIALGDGETKALVVALDVGKAPRPAENLARISARTGIPEENIFFFASHTHTAPVIGGGPDGRVNDLSLKPSEVQTATAEYETTLVDEMLRVIDEAIGTMRPARMGYAFDRSYVNVNRNQDYVHTDDHGRLRTECNLGVNPEGPVDHTLFVMKLEDLESRPLAFFMNYPVHNCVLHANTCCGGKLGISSDLCGYVCRSLEEKFAGCTAISSSGAAGDVNPVMMNETYYPDPATGRMAVAYMADGGLAALHTLATRHLADVLRAIRSIDCNVASAPIAGTVSWSRTPGRDVRQREDGTVELLTGEGVDPYEIRLHLVRVGEVALYGFSGELYSSLGAMIKQISPMGVTILIDHDAALMTRANYVLDEETLTREVPVMLPGYDSTFALSGYDHTRMLPGYVPESLKKHTLEMFARLFGQVAAIESAHRGT
jgi:hypothetical protein